MSLTISPAQIVAESDSPLLTAPDSWQRRPLGEIATILNGFAFKSANFTSQGGKPLIRIRDIFNNQTAVGYVGDYEERYTVRPGDLLVGMDGDFNCARWHGPEALLNQRVCKITPNPTKLDLDFLTHILPGYLNAIHDLTSSTTVTHLSSRDIAQIPIPVPPLSEQRALVQVFETARGKQRSSNAHLRTAYRAIERLRQALLMAACSGRLTAEWRRANPSEPVETTVARVHFVQSRTGRIATDNLIPGRCILSVGDPRTPTPEGWQWIPLLRVARLESGHTPSRKHPEYWNGPIPWVGIQDAREHDGCRIFDTRQHVSDLGLQNSAARLLPANTVCLSRTASVGYVFIMGRPMATSQDFVNWICSEALLPDFLLYAIQAEGEAIRNFGRGTTHTTIYFPEVKALHICLPPINEQREIIRRVAELHEATDRLMAQVTAATLRVDRSPQAVLAKAFRGELTVQANVGAEV